MAACARQMLVKARVQMMEAVVVKRCLCAMGWMWDVLGDVGRNVVVGVGVEIVLLEAMAVGMWVAEVVGRGCVE